MKAGSKMKEGELFRWPKGTTVGIYPLESANSLFVISLAASLLVFYVRRQDIQATGMW